MGINLIAKKPNAGVEICFGRSYNFKSNNLIKIEDMDFDEELDDIAKDEEKTIEKIKGLAKYTPKDIDDAYKVEEDLEEIIGGLLDEAQRAGSLIILKELKNEGFKFIEE